MSGKNSSRTRENITPKANMSGLVRFLRAKHPKNTAVAVEAATQGRVSESSVLKWLYNENGIGLAHLFHLVDTYGPAVLAAVWPADLVDVPAWIDDARRAQAKAERQAQIAALNIEIAALEDRRSERRRAS